MRKQQVLLVIISAVALFALNNLVLGAVVPRLPGGSSSGITTMFFVTLVSIIIKRLGGIPILYLVYGCIGLPSHLLAGDWNYIIVIFLLVLSSILFDCLLSIQSYSIKAYVLCLPAFVILMQMVYPVYIFIVDEHNFIFNPDAYTIIKSLLLAYSGMILAVIFYKQFAKNKFFSRFK